MTTTLRIETLEKKHAALDQLIEQEAARPLPDFLFIGQLKRQKLLVKEALLRLLAAGEAAA